MCCGTAEAGALIQGQPPSSNFHVATRTGDRFLSPVFRSRATGHKNRWPILPCAARTRSDNSGMRLSNRCYAVTGLGYSAPWCVNAGFVVGDHLTLVVDTGGNALAAQTVHGYASAARPGNQLRVVNTEKHFDHIGGNGFFRERGIDVWGHVGTVRTEEDFQAEIAEFNDSIPDRKSTRLNSSHLGISYAVFCLKKKKKTMSGIPIGMVTVLLPLTLSHLMAP